MRFGRGDASVPQTLEKKCQKIMENHIENASILLKTLKKTMLMLELT